MLSPPRFWLTSSFPPLCLCVMSQKSKDKHPWNSDHVKLSKRKEFSHRTVKSPIFTKIVYSSNYYYRIYQFGKSPHQPEGKNIFYPLLGSCRPALLGKSPRAWEGDGWSLRDLHRLSSDAECPFWRKLSDPLALRTGLILVQLLVYASN